MATLRYGRSGGSVHASERTMTWHDTVTVTFRLSRLRRPASVCPASACPASAALSRLCPGWRRSTDGWTESLEPPTAPPKEQEENNDEQNEAEATPAVVAEARAHIVSAAAEKEQKDHENNDEWHAAKSSTS